MPRLSDDKINEITREIFKLTLDVIKEKDITLLDDITEIINRAKVNMIYTAMKHSDRNLTKDDYEVAKKYDIRSSANGWAHIKEKLFERK